MIKRDKGEYEKIQSRNEVMIKESNECNVNILRKEKPFLSFPQFQFL